MEHPDREYAPRAPSASGMFPAPLPPSTPSGDPTETPMVVAPMVYVQEVTKWAYKVVVRPWDDGNLLTESELNALGTAGWELTGVITAGPHVCYYFKRLVT